MRCCLCCPQTWKGSLSHCWRPWERGYAFWQVTFQRIANWWPGQVSYFGQEMGQICSECCVCYWRIAKCGRQLERQRNGGFENNICGRKLCKKLSRRIWKRLGGPAPHLSWCQQQMAWSLARRLEGHRTGGVPAQR